MKIGLVVEGGGMKCAYTAGILDKLLDNKITFDYAIGVSAGSSSTASFLAGQRDRNRRFFVEHVGEPGYMGFRTFLKTGSFFGLEYIYATLTNSDGADPIDYQTILDNPTEFKVVATDAVTGKPVYFDKTDAKQDDYRIFMASCAIPVVSKPIKIHGKYYFDGGCADPIPVRKALEDGCDKVVILLCRPKDTVRTPEKHREMLKTALLKYPKIFHAIDNRAIIYNEVLSFSKALEEQGKAFIIAPNEALPVSTYTRDPEILQGLYDIALKEFEEKKESLMTFLKG